MAFSITAKANNSELDVVEPVWDMPGATDDQKALALIAVHTHQMTHQVHTAKWESGIAMDMTKTLLEADLKEAAIPEDIAKRVSFKFSQMIEKQSKVRAA